MAAFVSAHGWGHAARCLAVLEALRDRRPRARLHLFTTVPGWFLAETLGDDLELHDVDGDVGLVQRDALREDAGATVAALDRFFEHFPDATVAAARDLDAVAADVVVADIAPLGIAAATRARVPSVLVENFTWDWIYEAYFEEAPGLRRHARRIEEIYARADLRIQAEPVSRRADGCLEVGPVTRRLRQPSRVRGRLGIDAGRPLVLVSMGGVGHPLSFATRLADHGEAEFLLLGDARAAGTNVRSLASGERPYHPDLMAAADVVVGKLGYSTVAEALQGGTRYGFVERPSFPETAVLHEYLRRRLPTMAIEPAAFDGGDWVQRLPSLLERPAAPCISDGATAAAEAILDLAG